jgi:hypothetical protein
MSCDMWGHTSRSGNPYAEVYVQSAQHVWTDHSTALRLVGLIMFLDNISTKLGIGIPAPMCEHGFCCVLESEFVTNHCKCTLLRTLKTLEVALLETDLRFEA